MGFRILCLTIGCVVFMQCGVHGFFGSFLNPFGFNTNLNLQISQDGSVNFTLSKFLNSSKFAAFELGNQSHVLHRAIETHAALILNHFGANITNLITLCANRCAELVEKAISFGGAIAECSQERFSAFETLINDTIADLEECVENKVEQGLSIANNLLNDKVRCLSLASNITRGLTNCTRLLNGSIFSIISPRVISCKLRLAAEVGRNFTILEADKARHLHDAALYLATFKIDLASCGFIAITRAAEEAALIASDIALCAANSTSTD